jgi:hypothetical protein
VSQCWFAQVLAAPSLSRLGETTDDEDDDEDEDDDDEDDDDDDDEDEDDWACATFTTPSGWS